MRYSLLLLVVMTAVACGSHVSSTDVQSFRSDALTVSAAASTYGNQTAQMQSVTNCMSLHQQYDSQVRSVIGRMQSVAPAMDSMMADEQHMSDGDMGCSADAMMAELDAHRSAACLSSTDMTSNVAEAQRHAALMTEWAAHEESRSQELGSLMGMGMGMSGAGTSTGRCQHHADGTYSLQP